jgi:hypothetical protein
LHEYLKEFCDFLDTANNESDRGKALVAAAQLDGMLEDILRAFLIDCPSSTRLFETPNAPLTSFYNKINLARSLGLISPDEHSALDLVRKVRNEFAHSVSVSFDDTKVTKLCMMLEFGLGELRRREDPVLADPRTRFSMSASSLVSSLYSRANRVSKIKLAELRWDS